MKKNKEEIELVEDWLRFAEENLEVAQSVMTEDYSPYHTVCFLCQGSAEKYLKAFLIWNGWELKKIHDLNELLQVCVEFDSEFEILREACKLLNEYIIVGRYPGDLPFESISKKNAEDAIGAAETIEKFVLSKTDLSTHHTDTDSQG